MKEQRTEWIDIAKFIGIISIMAMHSDARTKPLDLFTAPYFLNIFYFASGYVYRSGEKFFNFIKKKAKTLLLPWLIFGLFIVLSSHVFSFNEHDSLSTELKWFFVQIRNRDDHMWFLSTLFLAFIPFYFFAEKSDGSVRSLLLPFVLAICSTGFSYLAPNSIFPWNVKDMPSALPWHLELIFPAMFFMAAGYVFRQRLEIKFDALNTPKNRWILYGTYLAVFAVMVAVWDRLDAGSSAVILYLRSFIGVAAVIALSKTVRINPFISFVGRNTIVYYALNGKMESLLQVILRKIMGNLYPLLLSNQVVSSVFAVAISLITAVLLIIPTYIINRWFPFILGRTKPNTNK